ncbi:sigma-70 family RNA polymerase sigma factor [Blastopirellula marina]|uniref:Probable ECF-like sigma factor SigE n=1 Tax=Blastopirellula marina DSM 3645 TaxID=314230 RepID=A3ZT43_9BACT|nr:sigma-70 family RNA polymerase sigma factor [Blastopirellula marina]EAQ80471.1 probable ECF-like sigma factor SigE [Blastopirellula marina DSM 3645]
MPEISAPQTTDPTPFVELIVKHERALLRYIRSMVPRIEDAEEVWQSSAIVLWEKFAEYDATRDFLPWAQRFAYFEALKFRRSKARDRMFFSEDVMQTVAETHVASREILERRMQALQGCLQKLTDTDLNLLRSRYESEMTIGDLAKKCNTTAKSLYRKLDRIRDRLARCVRVHAQLADD